MPCVDIVMGPIEELNEPVRMPTVVGASVAMRDIGKCVAPYLGINRDTGARFATMCGDVMSNVIADGKKVCIHNNMDIEMRTVPPSGATTWSVARNGVVRGDGFHAWTIIGNITTKPSLRKHCLQHGLKTQRRESAAMNRMQNQIRILQFKLDRVNRAIPETRLTRSAVVGLRDRHIVTERATAGSFTRSILVREHDVGTTWWVSIDEDTMSTDNNLCLTDDSD